MPNWIRVRGRWNRPVVGICVDSKGQSVARLALRGSSKTSGSYLQELERVDEYAKAVDSLRSYSLDLAAIFPETEVKQFFDEKTIEVLKSENGRSYLKTWLTAFQRSMTILLDVRDQVLSGTIKIDEGDLRDIGDSAAAMVSALKQRIRTITSAA